jgi:hypothetical protein
MKTTFKEFINESILNLSKNKRFPDNFYVIYDMNKNEIGQYLNTWFIGQVVTIKDFIAIDEMWIVKKVDNETSKHLYNRKYNPISINIMCPVGAKFELNDKGEKLYNMKAQIHSIDDSLYGIWFNGIPLEDLQEKREKIMEYINNKDLINGEEFLNICVDLGADEDSKDYN